jgi:hypothetical protein
MTTRRRGLATHETMRLTIATVLALALLPSVAWARPLSDQERASLAATVESFDIAMREGNYARVAKIMPPKAISAVAHRAGATPDQIVELMINAMQETFRAVKFELFRMDLANASHKELANGTPYVLIPTRVVVVGPGRRVRESSHTLALLDEGKWFLLRIKDASQVSFLLDGHPEFATVEFPSGSIEASNP